MAGVRNLSHDPIEPGTDRQFYFCVSAIAILFVPRPLSVVVDSAGALVYHLPQS